MESSPQPWTVQCAAQRFRELRATPEFATIVNLGRAVNALRFASDAMPPLDTAGTPRIFRNRVNALMCSLSFLHETMIVARRCGQLFRSYPSFPRLAAACRSPEAHLVEESLRRLRNRAVFHFDEEEVAANLQTFQQDPCVLISGVGDTNGESEYELSDITAMQSFIGAASSQAEWLGRQRELVIAASTLSGELAVAADELIADYVAVSGFEMM